MSGKTELPGNTVWIEVVEHEDKLAREYQTTPPYRTISLVIDVWNDCGHPVLLERISDDLSAKDDQTVADHPDKPIISEPQRLEPCTKVNLRFTRVRRPEIPTVEEPPCRISLVAHWRSNGEQHTSDQKQTDSKTPS